MRSLHLEAFLLQTGFWSFSCSLSPAWLDVPVRQALFAGNGFDQLPSASGDALGASAMATIDGAGQTALAACRL